MDSFTTTILLCVVLALLASFIKMKKSDKCLNDFENDIITLLDDKDILVTGRLVVESTGLEFLFSDDIKASPAYQDYSTSILEQVSYILYKSDYKKIKALIRYHENLSSKDKQLRVEEIERTYHPRLHRRVKRSLANFFKTIRDSLVDIFSMVTGQMLKKTGSTMVAEHKKQTDKLQKELVETIEPAFEPLLEKYIGNLITCEYNNDNNIVYLKGILKDYTSEFIELLDVIMCFPEKCCNKLADVILPRRLAVVRGIAERVEAFNFIESFNIRKYKKVVFKSLTPNFLKEDKLEKPARHPDKKRTTAKTPENRDEKGQPPV